jgi:ribonuclease Z
MKEFELTILGSNSALPAYGRFPTSQVLRYDNDLFLIDCGEGTQMRLSHYKIKRNKISTIFISHHHGDHLYGLPGVITSMNHYNRTEPLTVVGPVGIEKYLNVIFEIGEAHINFDLDIIEINPIDKEQVYENSRLTVHAFPVYHRIPTYGYQFVEKQRTLNVLKDSIVKYSLTVEEIKALKSGNDIQRGETVIKNQECTSGQNLLRRYTYCADSKVDNALIPIIKDSDLLYFETTYMHELQKQAHERGHATSVEAATLARKANVKQLITGHYSSRYKDVQPLIEEAKSVFDNVIMGYDGVVVRI